MNTSNPFDLLEWLGLPKGTTAKPSEAPHLTVEVFDQMIASLRPQGPVVAGAVVRADRFGALKANCPEAVDPTGWGIPVYTDAHQEEECLMFEDGKLLRLYLNRRENPEDYYRYIADLTGMPLEDVLACGQLSLPNLLWLMRQMKQMQDSIASRGLNGPIEPPSPNNA